MIIAVRRTRRNNFLEKFMNTQMQASWRKMVGIALLWFALTAVVYVPTSAVGTTGAIVACLGFAAFAFGLALFADGLKRDIVLTLSSGKTDPKD